MDDMFVILNALSNLKLQNDMSLEYKIGMSLVNSGGAILMTTVTDVFAFCVGSWTVSET